MSHLIKCDGCGRIENYRVLGWVKCDMSLTSMADHDRVIDLCPNCWRTIKQTFMAGMEEKE